MTWPESIQERLRIFIYTIFILMYAGKGICETARNWQPSLLDLDIRNNQIQFLPYIVHFSRGFKFVGVSPRGLW
ncbi:hypothetical protein Sjap_006246 [Stephania japonica]|uniref:Uncharacterized protein n=1 Tax=Stephania japonica TaxID=461633 RepID=A0AAP0K709_9MAGN